MSAAVVRFPVERARLPQRMVALHDFLDHAERTMDLTDADDELYSVCLELERISEWTRDAVDIGMERPRDSVAILDELHECLDSILEVLKKRQSEHVPGRNYYVERRVMAAVRNLHHFLHVIALEIEP